ncbi:DUF3885 domain-containing protein [Streptomyces atratus]|uniref:DUF3885 domain-containing protein n=1 Tax=Streptomyces atratus TaxID=1893 RepID=UPI003F53E91A
MLRSAHPELRVRFHSFPHSKRYPEDAAEYATVPERYNAVLAMWPTTGKRAETSYGTVAQGATGREASSATTRSASRTDPLSAAAVVMSGAPRSVIHRCARVAARKGAVFARSTPEAARDLRRAAKAHRAPTPKRLSVGPFSLWPGEPGRPELYEALRFHRRRGEGWAGRS